MRSEARDEFLRLVNAAARELGGSSFQDGIDLARGGLAWLTELLDSVRTPELLAQKLDETDFGPQTEWLMRALAGFGPQLLRWVLSFLNQTAEDTLPNVPNRPPAVAASDQLKMLRFINELHFDYGVELQQAKSRAAKRFGCGVRTVERYWRERREILANGPKPHFSDLIEGLKASFEAEHRSGSNGTTPLPLT
jgi:hypothetical protein